MEGKEDSCGTFSERQGLRREVKQSNLQCINGEEEYFGTDNTF